MWTKTKTTRNYAMFYPRDQTAQAVVEGDEADRFDQCQRRKPTLQQTLQRSIHTSPVHIRHFDDTPPQRGFVKRQPDNIYFSLAVHTLSASLFPLCLHDISSRNDRATLGVVFKSGCATSIAVGQLLALAVFEELAQKMGWTDDSFRRRSFNARVVPKGYGTT